MGLVACKCGCGQKIEGSIAYVVRFNGVSFKFLNEEHYLKWREGAKARKSDPVDTDLDKIYDVLISIMGKDPHAKLIVKEQLEEWKKIVPVDKIYAYLKESTSRISDILSKRQFSSIKNEIKYIGAIIKNNAPLYKPGVTIASGRNEQISKEAEDAGVQRNKRRISLAELEDEV